MATLPTVPDNEPRSAGGPPVAVIRRAVLDALGRPDDLLRVAVFPLWEGHYRVNVLTGADAACARVANSYFLQADDRGAILGSDPRLTRTD